MNNLNLKGGKWDQGYPAIREENEISTQISSFQVQAFHGVIMCLSFNPAYLAMETYSRAPLEKKVHFLEEKKSISFWSHGHLNSQSASAGQLKAAVVPIIIWLSCLMCLGETSVHIVYIRDCHS